jgi:hypothetical protein
VAHHLAPAGKPSLWRLAAGALAARLAYRPILLWVTGRSLARLGDGVPLDWGKLPRRGIALESSPEREAKHASSG